jgi:cell division protein FtsB
VLFQLKTYLPTAALAFLIFFFAFHALTGERGLLLAAQRREALAEKREELARLHAERQVLENKAHYLRNDSLSLDLLEERAQDELGFVAPGDYVIREGPAHR